MPYIPPARAASIDAGASKLVSGDLAYALSREIADFFRDKPLNYARIAEVRGAVAAALNEFERRVVEPYEDSKIMGGGADPYTVLADEAAEHVDSALRERIRRHDVERKAAST